MIILFQYEALHKRERERVCVRVIAWAECNIQGPRDGSEMGGQT